MILPTKHVPLDRSALGTAALSLSALSTPRTVSELWEIPAVQDTVGTFDQLVLGLDLLYTVGLIQYKDGRLVRA
jgi:hypothetical protein